MAERTPSAWLPEWARPNWLARAKANGRASPKSGPKSGPKSLAAPRTIAVGGQKLPLVIRKLAHARQMSLRLSPDGREVRVSIPQWGRVRDAEEFALSRSEWLARHLAAQPQPTVIQPGASVPFRGDLLTIAWGETLPRRAKILTDRIELGGPHASLGPRLQRALETEARRLFAEDVAHFCARAGEQEPRLMLSRAQRRWGSCSADRTIRLNWRLVMAPDAVRRSVVAHEVAHLAHFDHSAAFHAALARIYDNDLDAANAWLKRDGRGLYAAFG